MLEGALRRASMCQAYYRTFSYSQEVYRSCKEQFLNANFAWNQYEVPQNSRYAEIFFCSSLLSAQTVATLLWYQMLTC